jgi:hypothetical protein
LSIAIDEEDLEQFLKKVASIDTRQIRRRISNAAEVFKIHMDRL